MKRTTGLAALAVVTIAGLAPATALSPQRALAGTGTAAAQAPLWVTHQDVVNGGINAQVAASPDGSAVFVAGQMTKRTDVAQAVLWAYDPATGAALWQEKYTAAARSLFDAVAVSPDSATVFATGRAQATSRSAANYLTVAYNAATGAQEWADGSAPQGGADAIAVSPGGSTVFVTGATGTAAYNAATGATLWTAAAGSASIAAAPDGSAVYVSSSLPFGYRNRYTAYLTTALDAGTGDTLWTAQYDVPKGNSSPAAVAATSTGSAVIVTGTTRDSTGTAVNFGTVAYNTATGAPVWTARYRGPASGYGGPPEDVAISPDGAKVLVTGYNWSASPGSQPEFATVAYDSGTGTQLWVARYGQPAKEATYGMSVAVSPDSSKVFVTGDTGNDGATVAYHS